MVEKTKMNSKGDAMPLEETSVDWRGRPCKLNKHGGMTSAVFVLGLSFSTLSHISLCCLILCHVHHVTLSHINIAWPCSCMSTKSK